MRRWRAGILASTLVLAVAGCSHGISASQLATTGGTTAGATTAGGTTAGGGAPGSGATSAPSPTAVPASVVPTALTSATPSATGQLRVLKTDDFPVASNDFLGVIAAEAPDGSVFATFGSQKSGSPATTAGTAVYVIDGNQQAQVAEHPTIAVTALAADDTYLYAGGGTQIIEYSRATGAVVRTWNLALPVRLMTAGAGMLWAVLGSTSGPGQVVEISPDASTVTTVGTDSASVSDIAVGPLGLYYVPAGGTTIVHITASGQRVTAPTNETIDEQLSGAGAVQAISVIDGQLLLVTNAGDGLDSVARTYNASTLAGPQTEASGTAGSNDAIDSLAGPIDIIQGESPACAGVSCVGRYNLSTGAVTDALAFSNARLGLLLGPDPAVIVFPYTGNVYLDRVG